MDLHHFFHHLIHEYGLVVVALVIAVESIGLPFPGETVLVVAGILAGTQHDPDITLVILTAGAAAFLGQIGGYFIGREYGYRLLLRYGSYVRITTSRIKLGEYLFLRYGSKIVFISRFVPVLRSLAGILAGSNRMPLPQFLLANAIGAFAWAGFFGLAAFMLGRQVEHVARPLVIAFGIVAAVVIAAAIVFISRHEAQLTAEAERALPGPLE
jgi:membrane protein DedA with SNARE-associated domain